MSPFLCVIMFVALAVFAAYKKIAGCDIEESIKGETTGNLENLLLAVGKTLYVCVKKSF